MNYRTEMYEVRDTEFPAMVFSFKPFGEIASSENADQSSFFDIIGVITSPGRVVKQSRYRLIEVEISDEHHNKILCTIWDSNVESYLSQLSKAEGTVPIIIVQFCKPNVFRGEIGVSTHYQASKILINADIDEVKEFRSRIKHDDTFLETISVGQPGMMVNREFDDLDVKALGDVVCLEQFISDFGQQDGSYWVFGKVESIEPHFGEWYYLACKTCVKKVRILDDKKFRCDFCIKNFDVAVKRFRFVANIVDDSSNASILLWDREVVQLIGKKGE
ncbi:replication protein A 70 kDa DNA-binding subunit D-like [Salvia hispanica]|uniref:replication protein A 70 kDa DNA-binding subunit D-like n=1 Tax=Salvia hispanica TaxID=49212 RepID=UPI002009B1A2|nr:replication protein A 70 kDa DNA-binding subunit D-like [Salvia hispanica]